MNTDLVRQDALRRRKFLGTLAAGALIPSLTVSAVPASLSLIQSVLGEAMPAPIAKALIVIGDATETVDTLYPYYRLIEAGIQPVVIAPEKRLYQMVMHEIKPGWTITKEWEGYTLEANLAFSQVKEEEYLGIMFSGGRAPEYIRYDKDLVRMTKYFFLSLSRRRDPCLCRLCAWSTHGHGGEMPFRFRIMRWYLRQRTLCRRW